MVSEVSVSAKDKLKSLVEDLWTNGDISREACNQLTGLALEISGQIPPVYKFRIRRIDMQNERDPMSRVSIEIIASKEEEALQKARDLSDHSKTFYNFEVVQVRELEQ